MFKDDGLLCEIGLSRRMKVWAKWFSERIRQTYITAAFDKQQCNRKFPIRDEGQSLVGWLSQLYCGTGVKGPE